MKQKGNNSEQQLSHQQHWLIVVDKRQLPSLKAFITFVTHIIWQ